MQVPLTDIEYDPVGPPSVPLPGSILILGGYRWLGMDGQLRVVAEEDAAFAEQIKDQLISEGSDPQMLGYYLSGERVVPLRGRELAYWEAAAVRGGHVLSELIV
jgi:hypothetical protein